MTYTITEDLFQTVVDRLFDLSTSVEIEPRSDYSGRGMYGKTCVGFVSDNPTYVGMALTSVLIDLENDGSLETVDEEPFAWYDLNPAATDSMGRQGIIYFPKLAVEQTSQGYRDWISAV